MDERHDAPILAKDLIVEAIARISEQTDIDIKLWSRPGTTRPVQKQPNFSWVNVAKELEDVFEFENSAPESDQFMHKLMNRILVIDGKTRSLTVDTENYDRIKEELETQLHEDIVKDLIDHELRALRSQ